MKIKKNHLEYMYDKFQLQMYANPLLPTDGTHELQERYANTIVALFRLQNNIRQFAGTDYTGDPKAGSIKIPVRNNEVSVQNYDVVTGVPLTTSATVYLTVVVDNNVAVNELIDGYEALAVPDNIVAQRLDSAAYEMQRTEELDFIDEIRENGTLETSEVETDDDTVYKAINTSIGELLAIGVPINSIYVGITTDTETKLLTDEKFTNTASTIGSERVMQGVIGKIRGAEVARSSNLGIMAAGPQVGNPVEYVVFSNLWAQKGDEWKVMPMINDLKDGVHIGASALQGRNIFWNTLTDAAAVRVKTFEII